MISVILSWLFISILAFCIGTGFHALLTRSETTTDKKLLHFTVCCITGLLVIAFLSTLYCLFLPLDIFSNLFLCIIAFCAAWLGRKQLKAAIRYNLDQIRSTGWFTIFLLIAFTFVLAYLSYLPSSHYDDGLYYSTSIKWLEEYGTVKGLANINTRIGYDSSWFILQASFGFRWLKAGLFNDLNGLMCLYVFAYSLGGMRRLANGDTSIANGLRALCFLPLLAYHFGSGSDFMLFNVNFLSSSTADLPVCLITWMIFILYAEGAEHGMPNRPRQWLLIFYIMILLTIKLSSAPLLLLPALFVVNIMRRRNWSLLFLTSGFAALTVVPWLIRNVMVSGYIVFPFSALDFFEVDWKVPIEHARYHENAVMAYAVDPKFDFNTKFRASVSEWFPGWFDRLFYIQAVVFSAVVIQSVVFVSIAAFQLFKRNYWWFQNNFSNIFFSVTAFAGITFWFMKGPDFRFGYGFAGIYLLLGLTLMFRYFLEGRFKFVGNLVYLCTFLILVIHYKPAFKSMPKVLFKPPVPYRMPENMKVAREGLQKFILTEGESWNAELPACNESEYLLIKPTLRGKSIKEGFRASLKENQMDQ
ncbi:MAG: hypothetical protein H7Y27_08510 [Gemmatimonadaceae bacterium]|nr:hypothetical protein [Chitinophagaceae bacterium]